MAGLAKDDVQIHKDVCKCEMMNNVENVQSIMKSFKNSVDLFAAKEQSLLCRSSDKPTPGGIERYLFKAEVFWKEDLDSFVIKKI